MPNAIRICTLSRARSPVTRFYLRNSRWVIITVSKTNRSRANQTTMAQAVFAPSPRAPGARARIGTGHTRSKPRVPPRATADGDGKQQRRTEVKFEREVPAGDERERDVCVTCGFVDYRNPKVVVGSVPVWVSPSGLIPSMHLRVAEPRPISPFPPRGIIASFIANR